MSEDCAELALNLGLASVGELVQWHELGRAALSLPGQCVRACLGGMGKEKLALRT